MEINQMVTGVDTNTEGGPTRIVTSGIPRLKGTSVGEKMACFKERHDSVRDQLLNHPRGYPGMFGAVLTEPSHPDADIGVFFMTNTGYLNMCVHSALGVAAACLETGMISRGEGETIVKLDTPAGLIPLKAQTGVGKLEGISIEPGPAAVHPLCLELDIEGGIQAQADLVFSAVWFIMIDVSPLGLHVTQDHQTRLQSLAVEAIETANRTLAVTGDKDDMPRAVDLAFLFENTGGHSCKSAVYSPAGVLDQSPCGAGTAARIALACQNTDGRQKHAYTNVNMFNRKFEGRHLRTRTGTGRAEVFTEISGSARVTGFHQFTIE